MGPETAQTEPEELLMCGTTFIVDIYSIWP